MNHQFERPPISESNGREVAQIARGQTPDAEPLGKRHDRTIDQVQTEICEPPIHVHRARELVHGRGRIRKSATREVLHQDPHGPALITQKICDFSEHQARNVPRVPD